MFSDSSSSESLHLSYPLSLLYFINRVSWHQIICLFVYCLNKYVPTIFLTLVTAVSLVLQHGKHSKIPLSLFILLSHLAQTSSIYWLLSPKFKNDTSKCLSDILTYSIGIKLTYPKWAPVLRGPIPTQPHIQSSPSWLITSPFQMICSDFGIIFPSSLSQPIAKSSEKPAGSVGSLFKIPLTSLWSKPL